MILIGHVTKEGALAGRQEVADGEQIRLGPVRDQLLEHALPMAESIAAAKAAGIDFFGGLESADDLPFAVDDALVVRGLHRVRSGVAHVGQHVAVDIEGKAYIGVPQKVLHELGIYALL